MNYGLTDRALDTLNEIFTRHEHIKRVVIYGSRAMGTQKNGSDIDISIEADDGFTDNDLLRLCGALENSDLPYRVDCSILSNIGNQDLKDHIARVGKVLYERAEKK